MAVTEVDYWAMKERIATILKHDTTNLYNASASDKTKFRKIEAGAPDMNKPVQGPFPRIFITNEDRFDEMSPKGVVVSRNQKLSEHIMRFLIIAVCEGKDGPDAEEKIDDFTKLILQKIKNHNDLSKPTDNTDPLADWSFPESVDILNRELIGDKIAGRVVRLKVKTTTG